MPILTAAIVLGIAAGQVPSLASLIDGVLAPGLRIASRRLMRSGIVLLGLKLSLIDIAGLGWIAVVGVVAVLLLTFVITLLLARLFRLSRIESLLIAAGFSICGVSAIGAMSASLGAKEKDAATPVALVTLCGTLAVVVLPLLWHPLGLDSLQFGHWVGASVHDVGQVVATAQVAGSAALVVAVAVKLTRVLMLAPMVAITSVVMRAGEREAGADSPRPPIVPLFIVGFVAAVLVRTWLGVPEVVLAVADIAQTALFALALVALGSAVRLGRLVRTGWRSLTVALLSWLTIAVLAWAAVVLL